jgi:hypothetical protein
VLLWQLYQSPKCHWFYIGLLSFGLLLVLITIVDGFKIADSPMFIALELLLNFTVTADLALRIKLNGFRGFLEQQRCWNTLDLVIVVGCNLLFIVSLVNNVRVGELSDEVLLLFWIVGQALRMLVIARKQKKAIEAAKILIDINDIGLETERNELGGQTMREDDIDEEIVFDQRRKNPAWKMRPPNSYSQRKLRPSEQSSRTKGNALEGDTERLDLGKETQHVE